MKVLIVFLTVFLQITLYAQTKSIVKYNLIDFPNLNSAYIINLNGNKIELDKPLGVEIINLEEPYRTFIVVNDTVYQPVYLNVNEVSFRYSNSTNEFYFQDELNKDFKILSNLREASSKISNIYLSEFKKQDKFNSDSLLNLFYQSEHLFLFQQYNFCLSKPNSFLNLDLLKFLITSNNTNFNLDLLFNNIDSSLFEYPTYKLIKWSLLNRKSLNTYAKNDVIENDTILSRDNSSYNIMELFDGKDYMYIDFWTSDCQGSKLLRTTLVENYDNYKNKIQFISISTTNNWDVIDKTNQELNINWQNYVCLRNRFNPLFKKFKILNIVEGFIINKNGVILAANIKPQYLQLTIEKLLSQD